MVNQKLKELGITYKARIQVDLFEDLFKNRVAGSNAKIPKAMEAEFMGKANNAQELRIQKYIRDFHKFEIKRAREEIEKQTKRLILAEKTLLTKVTKKAQTDQRVATDKIDSFGRKILQIESGEVSDFDSRIYPGYYAPLVTMMGDEYVIAPLRYQLRPQNEPESFDRSKYKNYNARRDNLDKAFWWKSLYGKNHAIMEILAFWENVPVHKYEHRDLADDEKESNIVLKFEPRSISKLIIPCIFDHNEMGEFPLDSFAAITDDPNPEVEAAGHDRTPVFMKNEYSGLWLRTKDQPRNVYDIVFEDKQPTYFEHALSA